MVQVRPQLPVADLPAALKTFNQTLSDEEREVVNLTIAGHKQEQIGKNNKRVSEILRNGAGGKFRTLFGKQTKFADFIAVLKRDYKGLPLYDSASQVFGPGVHASDRIKFTWLETLALNMCANGSGEHAMIAHFGLPPLGAGSLKWGVSAQRDEKFHWIGAL